ncbi:histone-lysine N-methyltransferase SETMAR [Trichonephila clavipes]|nr:histone-lysine N-methyltransferase SETMAR [Trichonephila clavipes]
MLGRRIVARQPPPTCRPELRRTLLDEWCNIPQDQIDNLILSMPRRSPIKNDQLICLLHNCTEVPKIIANKRRGKLSKDVLLFHDNVRSRTSRTNWQLIEPFGWEVLVRVPCCPDLAPSDFHLFRYLKRSLGGKRFGDNEEVKAAVSSWLPDQGADFFEEGFQNLVLRENAMANAFWVSVRNNISKRWNTTENDGSKNQSSADSAIRLPNTSIPNSNAADITEYFLDVPNYIILNIL